MLKIFNYIKKIKIIPDTIFAVITQILLFLFYFLFLTPYALLVKPLAGDILKITIVKQQKSYWQDKSIKNKDIRKYLRQF